jgi:hypothetical protein
MVFGLIFVSHRCVIVMSADKTDPVFIDRSSSAFKPFSTW